MTAAAAEGGRDSHHPWRVVASRLPRRLAGDRALAWLDRSAPLLPPTALTALELRLADAPEAPVDLSFRLDDRDDARRLDLPLPPSTRTALDAWVSGAAELAPVESVWLELDQPHDPASTTLPEPVVCARIASARQAADRLANVARALRGTPLTPAERKLFERVLAAMPAHAALLYLFGLTARGSEAVRIEMAGLDSRDMLTYLESIGSPTVQAVRELAPLIDRAGRTHLSVELERDRILPRTGIELSYRRLPHDEPRWRQLLDALVGRGHCRPEAWDALFAWPGASSFWTDPGTWPTGLVGTGGGLARTLSHVKLVCRPDGPPEAKAYLLYRLIDRTASGAQLTSRATEAFESSASRRRATSA